MTIRIIGSAHPLRGGGISTFNERLAAVLQQQGHDVLIYSFSLQYPSVLFPGKSQHTDEPPPPGIRIRSIINSVNPLNWLSVGKLIKAERPDIVIVRFWTPFMGPCFGTILRLVRGNRHTRIIAITDNVVAHEKKAVDLMFTRYFFGPVHRFVTMSGQVMKDLRAISSKPALELFHPLYDNYGVGIPREEALAALKLDASKKYALFFGFIRKYKGLDLLLEAMADPRVAAQDIDLIVAGEYYGDAAFYEGIIEKHGLQSRVHLFTEFIPNDAIKLYFSAADCVVLPYRSATQSGITQVAYHFERGMLATRVGGLPEAVKDGETGILCDTDVASIAEGLLRYFAPGSLPQLQQNLQRTKAKYSWKAFTDALIAFAKS